MSPVCPQLGGGCRHSPQLEGHSAFLLSTDPPLREKPDLPAASVHVSQQAGAPLMVFCGGRSLKLSQQRVVLPLPTLCGVIQT